jgi:hypothetical protein
MKNNVLLQRLEGVREIFCSALCIRTYVRSSKLVDSSLMDAAGCDFWRENDKRIEISALGNLHACIESTIRG